MSSKDCELEENSDLNALYNVMLKIRPSSESVIRTHEEIWLCPFQLII